MASTNVIGDSQEVAVQPVVSAMILGVVAQADLEDKDNAVNNRLYSGKQDGAVYIVELTAGGKDIAIADGSASTDKWQMMVGTDITPA